MFGAVDIYVSVVKLGGSLMGLPSPLDLNKRKTKEDCYSRVFKSIVFHKIVGFSLKMAFSLSFNKCLKIIEMTFSGINPYFNHKLKAYLKNHLLIMNTNQFTTSQYKP